MEEKMTIGFDVLVQESTQLCKQTEGLKIATSQEQEKAGLILSAVKKTHKAIEGVRSSMVKPLNDNVKVINNFFRGPREQLESAEVVLKKGLMAFELRQERLRAEEQARVDKLVREEAAVKQRALDAIAKKAEDAEKARLLELSEKAKASGDHEIVEALQEKVEEVRVEAEVAAPVKAPIVASTFTRAKGSSIKKTWRWKLEDIRLVPTHFLLVDEVLLSNMVKAGKGKVEIPGISQFPVESMSFKA